MNGHNIFISGHGGSGKSFAKEIFKKLSSIGKKVAIICSTAWKCLTKSVNFPLWFYIARIVDIVCCVGIADKQRLRS